MIKPRMALAYVYIFSNIVLLACAKEQNKMDANDLKKKLTPLQYEVTQKEGTEAPFQNEYWDHKEAGIYVDVVTGDPLFTSLDKFDSKSGWPSFTKPISDEMVTSKVDTKLGMVRTEIRSKKADSHLGHVFNDGPKEKGGMRYCINSAALRFVPVDKLKDDERYKKYIPLFEKANKK